VVSSSAHLGLGPVEPLGNASSCILSSPSGNRYKEIFFFLNNIFDPQISAFILDRVLSVRCGPQAAQPQVYLSTYPRPDIEKNKVLKDVRWEQLNASYEEVRLEKLEGRNFLSRMELLMASLTYLQPSN
jgi:mediator of RNA polymerase II transcription subunit 17